ncbi:hypothetical protein TcG_10563 [Trypanosoma cruzi]|nr:hypothetical protein TcG_10563 [Trypanosoma cruzi]
MDAARGCQDEPHVCGGPQCSGQVDSHPRLPPLTKGQRHGEEKPAAQCIQEGTRRSTAIRIVPQNSNANSTQPRQQQEERGASNSTTVLYLPLPRRNSVTPHSRSWWVTPHTHSEARRTPSAFPSALNRAPSHPRTIAMGNTNDRLRGPSMLLAEKKK